MCTCHDCSQNADTFQQRQPPNDQLLWLLLASNTFQHLLLNGQLPWLLPTLDTFYSPLVLKSQLPWLGQPKPTSVPLSQWKDAGFYYKAVHVEEVTPE
jgi:hypothetical protein